MLLFDSLCGNTDRHQENWGLVRDATSNHTLWHLSPCFDNGTSLGYELSEAYQSKWTNEKYERYIEKGFHHMKWRRRDQKRIPHIGFVQMMASLSPESKIAGMVHPLERFNLAVLRDTLTLLSSISMPVMLSEWRANHIHRLVELRREKLLRALT